MMPHFITLPLSTLENMLCELNGRFDELFDLLELISDDLHDLKLVLSFSPSSSTFDFDPLRTIGKYE